MIVTDAPPMAIARAIGSEAPRGSPRQEDQQDPDHCLGHGDRARISHAWFGVHVDEPGPGAPDRYIDPCNSTRAPSPATASRNDQINHRGNLGTAAEQLDEERGGDHEAEQSVQVLADRPPRADLEHPAAQVIPGADAERPSPRPPSTDPAGRRRPHQIETPSQSAEITNARPVACDITIGSGMAIPPGRSALPAIPARRRRRAGWTRKKAECKI